jgi:iron complex outermembrane receptor protein
LLEDIQQVEVISGPGGTLYGPNAVNGVVTVTTKDAHDTLGTLVRATAGAEERTLAARQGVALGRNGAIRFYADWHDNDGLPRGTGAEVDDAYRGWQAGFRSDFVTEADHVTFQGDIFRTKADTGPDDIAKGHNLLARWTRALGAASSLQVQAYYDWFKRHFTLVDDSLRTLDAEAQFTTTTGRHELVAGSGIRTTRDEFINQLNVFNLNPPSRRLWVYNGFVQDSVRLSPELSVVAGVKAERSSFSGWQVLPNLRLAWQPNDRNLVWAAVSRAVRTPSRIDRQLEAPPILAASPDFASEKLVAVEAGYRGQPSHSTSLSVSAFLNFYDDLRTTEFVNGAFQLGNGRKGRTYGIEAWGTAQIARWWRVSLGGATLWKDLRLKDGHVDFVPRNSVGNDPNWQLVGRSDMDLTPRLRLTLNARAVGGIGIDPQIGSYADVAGQLAYRLTDQLQLFVAGRSLLEHSHAESNDPGAGQLAKRSVIGGVRVSL